MSKYRVVMDGRGGLNVEKLGGWFDYLTTGSKWVPLALGAKDLIQCEDIIKSHKLREAGSTNKGKVVREYD